MMGGKADGIYLVVADMGDMGGSGLEFIGSWRFSQIHTGPNFCSNDQMALPSSRGSIASMTRRTAASEWPIPLTPRITPINDLS